MLITTLAAIPSPPQGVWFLGYVPIRGYALSIICGIFAAIWLGRRRYAARGGNPELILDAAIVAIPAGIIGGRAYHVMTDWQKYFCSDCNPIDVFKITNGGLGIWGAVVLGSLAVWGYLRFKGVPFAPFADALAPGVVLAQGIGRLGNWFNQELYGAETTVPWALEIYRRVDEQGNFAPITGHSTGEILLTVHPTFLYELLWNVLVCVVIIRLDAILRLGYGRVFALYIACYTLGRFFIENMRVDEATMIYGMRINAIVAVVVCAVATLVFFRLPKGREEASAVQGGQLSSAGTVVT